MTFRRERWELGSIESHVVPTVTPPLSPWLVTFWKRGRELTKWLEEHTDQLPLSSHPFPRKKHEQASNL
jgi:hypothetical protein